MWGDKEDMLQDVWEKQGFPPDALEKKPDLPPHLVEAYRAFRELSTRRQVGFSGISPIPLTDVLAYLEIHADEDLDVDEFVALIIAADSAYVNHVRSLKTEKVQVDDGGRANAKSKR